MSQSFIGKLRTKATDSEKVFYSLIKDLGLHCVFQKLFLRSNNGHYYIDFRLKINRKQLTKLRSLNWPVKSAKCIRHHILVEIDGEYHNKQQSYDFQREQEIINKQGIVKYHFIRFTNNQVLYHSSDVLKELYAYCKHLWGIELQYSAVRAIMIDNQVEPIKYYSF